MFKVLTIRIKNHINAQLYAIITPKLKVNLEGKVRAIAMLDIGAEINIMTLKLPAIAGLTICLNL